MKKNRMPGMNILQRGSTFTELWASFWHICRATGEVKREAAGKDDKYEAWWDHFKTVARAQGSWYRRMGDTPKWRALLQDSPKTLVRILELQKIIGQLDWLIPRPLLLGGNHSNLPGHDGKLVTSPRRS